MRGFTGAVAVLAALAFGSAASAQECTEAEAERLSGELFAMIEADPSLAERMETAIAEVEAEYGGEPSEAETCEAIEKLMTKLKPE